MNWFKTRRIAKLQVQLAGAVAADRCERELANTLRQCSPSVLVASARLVAELEEKLRQATEEPLPVIDPDLLDTSKEAAC